MIFIENFLLTQWEKKSRCRGRAVFVTHTRTRPTVVFHVTTIRQPRIIPHVVRTRNRLMNWFCFLQQEKENWYTAKHFGRSGFEEATGGCYCCHCCLIYEYDIHTVSILNWETDSIYYRLIGYVYLGCSKQEIEQMRFVSHLKNAHTHYRL